MPLVCAGFLLTGWKAAFARAERSRTPPDLPEEAAFHPVSGRPAQTSGVRKRLPFSLWARPQVTPLLKGHLEAKEKKIMQYFRFKIYCVNRFCAEEQKPEPRPHADDGKMACRAGRNKRWRSHVQLLLHCVLVSLFDGECLFFQRRTGKRCKKSYGGCKKVENGRKTTSRYPPERHWIRKRIFIK